MRAAIGASLLLAGLAACGGGGGGGGFVQPLAVGLRIKDIDLYQGVRIPLVRGGEAVPDAEREVPIIRGRPAWLRVSVEPESEWSPRTVAAKLDLAAKTKTLGSRTVQNTITGATTPGDPATSFNFELSAADVVEGLSFAVSLREVKSVSGLTGTRDGAIYPAKDKVALPTISAGEALKVVIVPIQYDADGSGRLPDTSQAQIDKLKNHMLARYPAPRIDMTVRPQPMPWSSTVSRNGAGWSQLLQAVIQLRQQDGAPADVYYYGMFKPGDTFSSYCTGGCVAGLSALATRPDDAVQRGSIGLGYTGQNAASTLVHEVGHAHGRQHAPCSVPGSTDPNYPHAGGTLGTWGYDMVNKQLIDPAGRTRDMMSYCEPEWVSDYTYLALLDRIKAVNQVTQRLDRDTSTTWRVLDVDAEGRVSAGRSLELRTPPAGAPVEVEVIESDGGVLGTVTGHFYPYSHLPGGMLLVPQPRAGQAIAVGGVRVDL